MIEYFSIAAVLYIGAIIWQSRQREGLYVHHLFLFFMTAVLWPVFCVLGVIVWLAQADFMNIRIRW